MLKIDVKTSETKIVLDVEYQSEPVFKTLDIDVVSTVVVTDTHISIDETIVVGQSFVEETVRRDIERKDGGLIAEFIERGVDMLRLRAVAFDKEDKEEREKHELS